MKPTRQNVLLAVVVLANLLLWIIPSNVVELVARDQHTLLGRYSRTHFACVLGMIPISAIALYLLLAGRPERMDAHETVAQEWCQAEGPDFVSLTPPLREAAAAGRQIYYTYDQHWTPVGHEVVAQVMARFCMKRTKDPGA